MILPRILYDISPSLYLFLVLRNYFIIPEVIDNAPKETATVFWNNFTVKADLGNVITPQQMAVQPFITWLAYPTSFYTLIMVDPDARSSNGFRHWLVVNIPGNTISKGTVKSTYFPAGPPQGTGLHRYIFLVYRQPSLLNFDSVPFSEDLSCLNRRNFSVRNFVKQFNLVELAATNFVRAEFDNSVPILYSLVKNCN